MSVAIDGDLVVLGAPTKDAALPGAAYIFSRNHADSYVEELKLHGNARAPTGDLFGATVGIAGNTLVVGAPDDNALSGAAYVYDRAVDGTWALVEQLLPHLAAPRDYFGSAVAVAGKRIAVGELGNASTHIFAATGDGWSERAVIGDGLPATRFGGRVVAGGSAIIVSAYAEDIFGVVYVFGDDTIFTSGFDAAN